MYFPPAFFSKNDIRAKQYIGIVSAIIFLAVVTLGRVQLTVDMGFNIHIFAFINACINGTVSLFLIAALIAIKAKNVRLHRTLMMASLGLSVLFLISYICHHLFAGETTFGAEGVIRYVYYTILITHIILAAVILPFILFTTYRALTAEYVAHKKLAKITFPLWLYVTISGVIVYILISPFYQ